MQNARREKSHTGSLEQVAAVTGSKTRKRWQAVLTVRLNRLQVKLFGETSRSDAKTFWSSLV